MKVLFVGDIYGKAGRRIASILIPKIREEEKIDFVIANGENSAGGFGITYNIFKKIVSYGVDCVTTGNHVWKRKEIRGYMNTPGLLRPLNYPADHELTYLPCLTRHRQLSGFESGQIPGVGSALFLKNRIGVINLMGRTFMSNIDCPFRTAIKEVENLRKLTKVIVVDFHAEATPEKQALAFFLDGKVSAVIGTHTHVQTADERILKNGTAYITDVGMTGSFYSVIGIKKEKSIAYFVERTPQRFDSAKGDEFLNGVIIDIDETTGKAERIKRIKKAN